jgi:hypothetical protein
MGTKEEIETSEIGDLVPQRKVGGAARPTRLQIMERKVKGHENRGKI